jgi:hypothetical protein
LRKTAACGGSQQFQREQSLDFSRGVAVDFAAEAYFFEIRTGPVLHMRFILSGLGVAE